jgi:metal-responsive CopG/Arc/MetJ family transcriptional regulator
MKPIVAKLDDDTIRELDHLAQGSSRSEVVREAVREYIVSRKMAIRRREVEEYMRTSGERQAMRDLAESDMDHAAELLYRVEHEE